MKKFILVALAALFVCSAVDAQILRADELEKYAKEKYGEKWVDAATNLGSQLTLDKNNNITYTQVIPAEGKTKVGGGWMGAMGGTIPTRSDQNWTLDKCYPFAKKDSHKKTSCKALVMAHAYSNVVMDKIEECIKNGLSGNENDNW